MASNRAEHEEQGSQISRLIAKCWADEGFKRKLLADPGAALKAEGIELPAGMSVKALENTDKVFHLVIPVKPSGDMSDAELEKVAGGVTLPLKRKSPQPKIYTA